MLEHLKQAAFLVKLFGNVFFKFTGRTFDMSDRVNIVFSRDKDGTICTVLNYQDVKPRGDTFEEARENIQEAVELYLETMSKEEIEESLGKELLTTTMEVKVG